MDKIRKIAHDLDVFERDCVITVALKIADDSRAIFMALYDALPTKESELFDVTVYDFISIGRDNPSAFVFSEIRELRKMAMEEITRPKMKAFKASVRASLSS